MRVQMVGRPDSWRWQVGNTAVPWLLAAGVVGVLLARLPLLTALALVGGTAAVLLIIINPLVGLGLTLLAGPLGAWEAQLINLGPFNSGQVLLLFTAVAWTARGLARRRLTIPKIWLSAPLLAYVLLLAFSLLWASSFMDGLREVIKWLEIWVVMVMVVDMAAGYSRLWLVGMLLLAGVSQGLLGAWQFGLQPDGPEHFLILDRFYRAYGTFNQPNPFGGFMNMSVLLGAGVLVGFLTAWWSQRRLANRDWVLVGLVMAATAVTGLGLFFSWSRGAWLGFVAGTAVLLFLWPPRLRWGTLFVVVGGLGAALLWQSGLVPPGLSERLTGFVADFQLGDVRGVDINDANYAVLERLAHWQAAVDMARDNLWLGVGIGNYEAAYGDYDLINWPAALGHAHNYYLNLLAETGLVGLVAYVLVWTVVIGQTVWCLRRATWPNRGILLGLMAVWAALAVHHLVDKLYVNNIYIHLGVLLGLLALLHEDVRGANPRDEVTL